MIVMGFYEREIFDWFCSMDNNADNIEKRFLNIEWKSRSNLNEFLSTIDDLGLEKHYFIKEFR